MEYLLLSKQMPERIQHVWRRTIIFTSSLLVLIALLVSGGLFFFYGWNKYVLLGVFTIIRIIAIWTIVNIKLVPYRYSFRRYEITSADLAFQKGYFFRQTTIVPINRIQHVTTEQGPFLRKENLMEIIVHTAATSHRIAGLDIEEAQSLREHIVALVKVAKEDV